MPTERRVFRPRSIQGRTAEQDVEYVIRFSCATCQITYYVIVGKAAHCPLCDSEALVSDLRKTIAALNAKVRVAEAEADRLRDQVDLQIALAKALEITSVDDLTWLKSVFYRWRADRSVRLQVAHRLNKTTRAGSPRLRVKRGVPPHGFFIIRAGSDGDEVETWVCSSVGGVALAGLYEEMLGLSDLGRAMKSFDRALSKYMKVAT